MKVLRAALVWLLVLSLPLEGIASVAMSHCKDLQASAAGSAKPMPMAHDHAAMMAVMDAADTAAHQHHAQHSSDADTAADAGASQAGCQCGCQCTGDCAVPCIGTMILLTHSGFAAAADAGAPAVAMPQGQAHAAYRHEPLRPPSAVAL